MKTCVIGTGYVGLVTGTCLAEAGHRVICVDCDADKVKRLQRGEVPLYEPGLEPLVRRNIQEGRLVFTTDLARGVRESRIVFIAVDTPSRADGSAALDAVFAVAEDIARALDEYKVVVTKSTVPVGTTQRLRKIICAHTRTRFDIASNPEFLREGTAVADFQRPDRIVIGTDTRTAATWLRELYAAFDAPVVEVSAAAAEMIKYAANCFLAARVSLINEIANISRAVGVDIDEVRHGIGLDHRIGRAFLQPGMGFGGSCFPKDVPALCAVSRQLGVETPMLDATQHANTMQQRQLADRVIERFGHDLATRVVAVWGLAFKPNTDDVRNSAAIATIELLLAHGAHVRVHDPAALDKAYDVLRDRVEYCEHPLDCADGAHALLLATDWPVFRNVDKFRLLEGLASPIVFDGRNVYDARTMEDAGFEYHSIGRPTHGEVSEPRIARAG